MIPAYTSTLKHIHTRASFDITRNGACVRPRYFGGESESHVADPVGFDYFLGLG